MFKLLKIILDYVQIFCLSLKLLIFFKARSDQLIQFNTQLGPS